MLGVLVASFLLLVHNHVLSLVPERTWVLPASSFERVQPAQFPVVAARVDGVPDDNRYTQRSRLRLWENGRLLPLKLYRFDAVLDIGQGIWVHRDGRVIFTATDNSDPRTNGRTYSVSHPPAYGPTWSRLALAGLALSLLGLRFLRPRSGSPDAPVTTMPAPGGFRHHRLLALLVFALGFYCNTGTLAPYAITHVPVDDPETGYLRHIDEPQHRALYEMLEGSPRPEWAGSVLLRRVLYPVMTWPATQLLGFRTGAVVGAFCWNLVGFYFWLGWMRKRWGDRTAIAAAWLAALYPGAAYWGGLPQVYGLIFPLALGLHAALHELETAPRRRLALWSALMGVAYLGYDFFVFFVPATVVLLFRRRSWLDLAISVILQLAPLAAWLLCLRFLLDSAVVNGNTGTYGQVIAAYLHPGDLAAWWRLLQEAPAVFLDVFFGANFLFLPCLFLALVVIHTISSRPLLSRADLALLAAALALFLFNNLAPDHQVEWPMRGNWIARLYQPVFVVLLAAAARWWGAESSPIRRKTLALLFGATAAANAFVVFGPIAGDPLGISGQAYYRFYNHSENHTLYHSNLRQYGRRPLGW